MTNRKSGKKSAFCLTALDPKGRLRYPLVSLFFDMCLTFWLGRGVQENLFHVEFVVNIGRLLGAKLAWLTSAGNAKNWRNLPNPESYANFSGPAGGRSLALAAP